MSIRTIGILTGGGDCPGLNAAIRAVVRKAAAYGISVLGVHNGWLGLIQDEIALLNRYSISGILPRGGTIIGTSRINPFDSKEYLQRIRDNWHKYGMQALIVVGGDGTLSAATRMWRDEGYPVVGIPKTIDNDLRGTDYTFGFDTAVDVATSAIDRLHTTAESHHRVMVVEVMGRHTGWIAAASAIAGGADIALVPEVPFRISKVCEILKRRREMGKTFSIVVVAEDARPHPSEDFLTPEQRNQIYKHERLGGIGQLVANKIELLTQIQARVTVLGYVQRGGTPTPFDRILASRFGIHAVELVVEGKFGQMVAIQGSKITHVPLEYAVSGPKLLSEEFYRSAECFFG
ncbi:MAG: ATP-dependent 6-phosphofructokinase [Acidobacteriota bacterium]|nr:6-phosphofructokinase [Blastocatellia bacterium]MDW8411369.1 ATP-dependent 6-phosphofructokinase [Acidobacteriota bacterium]